MLSSVPVAIRTSQGKALAYRARGIANLLPYQGCIIVIPICDCRQFLQFGGHATVGIDIVVGVSIGDGGASQQSALLL